VKTILDFSPDGRRLVFLRRDKNEQPTGIFVVRLDGSGLRRITPPSMTVGPGGHTGDAGEADWGTHPTGD
jgi:hypothetical protein